MPSGFMNPGAALLPASFKISRAFNTAVSPNIPSYSTGTTSQHAGRVSDHRCVLNRENRFRSWPYFRWMPSPHHSPKWCPGPSRSNSSRFRSTHFANPMLSSSGVIHFVRLAVSMSIPFSKMKMLAFVPSIFSVIVQSREYRAIFGNALNRIGSGIDQPPDVSDLLAAVRRVGSTASGLVPQCLNVVLDLDLAQRVEDIARVFHLYRLGNLGPLSLPALNRL